MNLKRLLTTCLMIMFFICIFNSVIAVGNAYQIGYLYNMDGKPQLVYRTIARAHDKTVDFYLKNGAKINEWDYSQNTDESSTKGVYKSQHLIFTKDKIGNYLNDRAIEASKECNDKFGYYQYRSEYSSNLSVLLAGVHHCISGVDDQAYVKLYEYDYNAQAVDKRITKSYVSNPDFLNKYNDNIIKVGSDSINDVNEIPYVLTNKFTYSSKYNEWFVNPVKNNYNFKEALVDYREYRRMIYHPDGDDNYYYISDIILDETVTEKLLNYYNSNKNKEGYEGIYVSAILNTNTNYSNGTKFYMLTPGAFLHSFPSSTYRLDCCY